MKATVGALKFVLTGAQSGILVLFLGGRVSAAVRQDMNSRMFESHWGALTVGPPWFGTVMKLDVRLGVPNGSDSAQSRRAVVVPA